MSLLICYHRSVCVFLLHLSIVCWVFWFVVTLLAYELCSYATVETEQHLTMIIQTKHVRSV